MYRSTKVLVYCLALLVVATGLAACGGMATNNATTNTGNTTNRTNTTNTTANTTTNTAANTEKKETASTGDKIGVPECDEYIEKFEACISSKVPEAARAAYKSSFETMRSAWKTSAANPQAKAALATGCKQALDTAKTTFATYSCQW